MDSYGLVMKGPFVCQPVSTLPGWTSADEGRFIYTQNTHLTYYASNTGWVQFGSGGVVVEEDTGYAIQTNDSGKTFVCNSATTQIFTLPSVDSSNIGIEFTISKIGVGQVTITAADSDVIEDSGAGSSIYCSDSGYATITLKLVTATQWIIKNSATGTWITMV